MSAGIDNGAVVGFSPASSSRYSSWKGDHHVSTYAGEHVVGRLARPARPELRWGIIRCAVVLGAILTAVFYLFTASATMDLVYAALHRSIGAGVSARAEAVARPETPSLVVIAKRPAADLAE